MKVQKENNRARMEENCILMSESVAFGDAFRGYGKDKKSKRYKCQVIKVIR